MLSWNSLIEHFKLWIFGSNSNLDISRTFDCKFGLQVQLVWPMLILLLHVILSPFTNLLLNLIFLFLHALFSSFANQLLNIVFVLLFVLLFFFRLVSTSKLLNLDYCFLHVLLSLANLNPSTLQHYDLRIISRIGIILLP